MPGGDAEAVTTFTPRQAEEIRGLLDGKVDPRKASRRMNTARLRHMGVPQIAWTSKAQFELLVDGGSLEIVEDETTARARIVRQPLGRVFRVAVGVTGDPVPAEWNAFNERYQWLGRNPQAVTSADHLFVLAVDCWRSAVVGLYETVSAGAAKLPGSSDPERWPWALGVRPLAAIPPPLATRVEGQRGPQSGLPERVSDQRAVDELYEAVADSPPPPGPSTGEHRVQELEREDVTEDVLKAVEELGERAFRSAVLQRAIEIGEWTDEELEARAWYTGGEQSHVRQIVAEALRHEHTMSGRLVRPYGSSPFRLAKPRGSELGVDYRRAGDRAPMATTEQLASIDIKALDRATRRHMEMQDTAAEELRERGIDPRSPDSDEPQFDLAFEHGGAIYVVEAKTGTPLPPQQVRIGVGQVLEYCFLLSARREAVVKPILLVEAALPVPWTELCRALQVEILRADQLQHSLTAVLSAKPTSAPPAPRLR